MWLSFKSSVATNPKPTFEENFLSQQSQTSCNLSCIHYLCFPFLGYFRNVTFWEENSCLVGLLN